MSAPVITEGVYDMPDAEYHGIKHALSCSGAKKLLPPSCPAIYRYELDNPPESKPHFDFGHAAHKMVLGVGAEIRYITSKDAKGNPSTGWATKDAKDQKAKAYAEGAIPLLEEERGIIEGMAAALRAHPIASALLNPENGQPEQSLFVVDEQSGIPLRARFDWLPNVVPGRRMIIVDFKTTVSADPTAIAKSVANYGYFMQDAFYSDMVRALGMDPDPAFVFVFQSKEPPYLVTVVELDDDAKRIGRGLNRRAIELYADCLANDEWPTYSDEVVQISLPAWFTAQHREFLI